MTPLYHQEDILERIAKGDEKAFNSFYLHTRPRLYQAAMTYLKDDQAAREIIQVAYMKLWERRTTLPELQSPEDYLFILVRNAIFDHFRKATVETRFLAEIYRQTPTTGDNVTTAYQEREDKQVLQQVLDQLSSRQQQVYVLANEYEMSYDEIARQLQVSKFTVKRHLEIARRYIRKNILRYFL